MTQTRENMSVAHWESDAGGLTRDSELLDKVGPAAAEDRQREHEQIQNCCPVRKPVG